MKIRRAVRPVQIPRGKKKKKNDNGVRIVSSSRWENSKGAGGHKTIGHYLAKCGLRCGIKNTHEVFLGKKRGEKSFFGTGGQLWNKRKSHKETGKKKKK